MARSYILILKTVAGTQRVGMVLSARLALPIANCIGETVCYLAKINKINSSPNWRNVILVVISDVISST